MSRLSGFSLVTTTPAAWTSLADTTIESALFTVPGAKLGDFVFTSVESDDGNEYISFGRVSSADTVRAGVFPDAGGGGVPEGTTFRIKVVPADTL